MATCEQGGLRNLGGTAEQSITVHALGSTVTSRVIPASEMWLWQNPEALRSVRTGLAEMGRGETEYLGSFAEYVDLDISDTE